MLQRLFTECLLRPSDVEPSHHDMEVIGTFNPGAVAIGDDRSEIVLLVRVAERPRRCRPGCTALPRYEAGRGIVVDQVPDDQVVTADPRVVKVGANARLTFVSHLRVMRSKDGRTIDSVDGPRFEPEGRYETFGVEDARITRIGDRFYFTYVTVSPHGAATALASTTDFLSFERHGVIFCPENKDVLLFPDKIGGQYMALHRPNPSIHFSPPEMWLADSDDLLHWGRHKFVFGGIGAGPQEEVSRVGGGCPPVRTDMGWLEIYHANRKASHKQGVGIYFGAAFMMDLDDPSKIVAHSNGPVMVPEADFETSGFVPDVVFPTALVERGDTVLVYYGAGDANTGVVGFAREQLLAALREPRR